MSAKDFIKVEGLVVEWLPDCKYKIQLDNGHKVLCTLAGRLKKYKIKIVPGDKVEVEISPYDLTKGRITYRL